MLAYSAELGGSAGAFISTDSNRTQLTYNDLNGREYIQHDSAMAVVDSARWRFGWTAPDSLVGDITFYAAFVAANNNQKRDGDYVFTHSVGVGEDTLRVSVGTRFTQAFQLYFNPQTDRLHLIGQLDKPQMITVQILDLQGRIIGEQKTQVQRMVNIDISTTHWGKGVYIVRLKEWAIARKIMIR